ncbi:MAG: alpha/beta hydrolase [Pseudomonadota bacterium]
MRGFILVFIAAIVLFASGSALPETQNGFSFSQVVEQPQRAPKNVLSYGESQYQTLHFWPGKSTQPAVFFIHGGCWLSEYDIKHSYPLTTALNNEGYSVYSAEYRRTGDSGGGWPTSFNDIKQAFRLFLEQQPERPDVPVVVSGHSAGGHLALLLAADAEFRNVIDKVIGLAAITDIKRYAHGDNSCQQATPAFMGGMPAEKPKQYIQANPAEQHNHPAISLLQGSADKLVDPSYATVIEAATVRIIDGASHFDLIHPQSEGYQVLLRELKEVRHDNQN